MKQRLGIAIALIAKPDLLILDEPINGLDPVAIKEFRQMIKKLSEEQGMTVLISSHILSELYQVSTRFGIIDHGHIIREITKDEFEHLSEDYIVLKTNQLALLVAFSKTNSINTSKLLTATMKFIFSINPM